MKIVYVLADIRNGVPRTRVAKIDVIFPLRRTLLKTLIPRTALVSNPSVKVE